MDKFILVILRGWDLQLKKTIKNSELFLAEYLQLSSKAYSVHSAINEYLYAHQK